MKAAFLVLSALLLTGCTETYRYPCQDKANKDNPECNRPACEDDGMCYDTLNGLPPKQAAETETTVEETSAAAAADCNNTGE